MRLLLDANLSPKLITALREAGYDADHVANLDMLTASDEEIFQRAATDHRTVVTADTDFSMLLALRATASPSVVLLRGVAALSWPAHATLLVANLEAVTPDLDQGAIVSLSPTRMAVRLRPLKPVDETDV
jgi:predicted nuclease of predicted toxin-antitoxin system